MKLSDIMSAAGLTLYPMIALVIFLVVFLAVAVRLLLPGRRARWEHEAALPLDDVNDRFVNDRAASDRSVPGAGHQIHPTRGQHRHGH